MADAKQRVEVVNIAATGDLGVEIDIEKLVEDVDFSDSRCASPCPDRVAQ